MAMNNPVHPGKIIKHSLEKLNLSVTDTAQCLGVTRQTLSRLINGKTTVSPEMAIRLSKAFGSTPEHWLRMQLAYDMAQIRQKADNIHVEKLPVSMIEMS